MVGFVQMNLQFVLNAETDVETTPRNVTMATHPSLAAQEIVRKNQITIALK